jgi:TonB family protein
MYNDYKDDCCAPFRPTGSTTKHSTVDKSLPEELDLALVRAGMASIKPKAAACGGKSSARGEVKVGVKVGPDGKVTSTTVKQTPDAALGDCVAAAVKKATFAKTQKGGGFTYPHRF